MLGHIVSCWGVSKLIGGICGLCLCFILSCNLVWSSLLPLPFLLASCALNPIPAMLGLEGECRFLAGSLQPAPKFPPLPFSLALDCLHSCQLPSHQRTCFSTTLWSPGWMSNCEWRGLGMTLGTQEKVLLCPLPWLSLLGMGSCRVLVTSGAGTVTCWHPPSTSTSWSPIWRFSPRAQTSCTWVS